MAEAEKQENEDELIVTETPPEQQEAADEAKPDEQDERLSGADDDASDEDDDGDQDGDDAPKRKRDYKSENRRKRERQKRGREHSRQEIADLRAHIARMEQLLTGVQGNQIASAEQAIDARLSQVQADAREAEAVMAQAVGEGDGNKVAQALRIRDAALAEAQNLTAQKQRIAQAKQPRQGPDPRVQSYASQWLNDNADWYNPAATDPQSQRVKQLDEQIAREGYNPATPAYWNELTRRCEAEFGQDDPEPAAPRRKAPPTGTTRQHAPASTRNEVYVSPERKAAMQAAGLWDDPVQRTAALKYYQQYDRENAG